MTFSLESESEFHIYIYTYTYLIHVFSYICKINNNKIIRSNIISYYKYKNPFSTMPLVRKHWLFYV